MESQPLDHVIVKAGQQSLPNIIDSFSTQISLGQNGGQDVQKADKAYQKRTRIGIYRISKDDGQTKVLERIFKIIKERDIEVDSDEEDACQLAKLEKRIHRRRNCDKDQYTSLYKKSRKLVRNSMDASKTFQSRRLTKCL